MKRIAWLWLILAFFRADSLLSQWTPQTVPNPRARDSGYVSDPHAYLSDPERNSLNERMRRLENTTGTEYAIVIVDQLPSSWEVQDFGVTLFEHWGLGKKGRDNGLLLLVVVDSHDWRFFTGYGLEERLTDALLRRLGENFIVPNFRNERYAAGLTEVTDKIMAILQTSEPQKIADYYTEYETWWPVWTAGMWIVWALALIVGIRFASKRPPAADKPLATYAVRIDDPQHATAIPGQGRRIGAWGEDRIGRFFTLHILSAAVPVFATLQGKDTGGPLFSSILGFYIWLTMLLFIVHIKRDRKVSRTAADKLELYVNLSQANRALVVKAFFFPLPFAFCYLLYRRRIAKLKKGSFTCPVCQSSAEAIPTRTLSEYLDEKQQFERKIHSIDHRIYRCPQHHILKIPFPAGSGSAHTACSACGALAVRKTAERTVSRPSYSHSGTGQKEFTCRFCGSKSYSTYVIPVLQHSSSDGGSSGGSSSGGGSWGGGHTGGGGAGGKW